VFEKAAAGEPRNQLSDWVLRGAIALVFVYEGVDKFGADSSWIGLFHQIGFGEWFRYFAGVVEITGGMLVLIPWAVTAGLALLACTMASAALIRLRGWPASGQRFLRRLLHRADDLLAEPAELNSQGAMQ
jgi:uncharacterized membrane protein YphA (DoxX/SURF4 family)